MRIVVTGIGVVSALGIGAEANRKALFEGKSRVAPAHVLPTVHEEWPVGEVALSDIQLKEKLHLDASQELTRNALLGMLAAQEAAEDADLAYEDIREMALVCGTTVGGMDVTEMHYVDWNEGRLGDVDLLMQHEAGTTAEYISHYLHDFKATLTVSTACSSALNALISGTNMLRLGTYRQVMVGGTEALTRFHLNGFAALGILSDEVCKPFSPERKGINLGEGAAFLVLETEESAKERGAHIYAYVGGYGNKCDAYHQTAPSPDGVGARLAMQQALEMGAFLPTDIDYINAHGTATQDNDTSEAAAIHAIFGENVAISTSPLPTVDVRTSYGLATDLQHVLQVSSTKSLTGHTTSACGTIELCFSLFMMAEYGYHRIMKNAFAFGGNDSSVILSADPCELVAKNEMPAICHIATVGPLVPADDADYKAYLTAMEARRMTPELRKMIYAAREVLKQAEVEQPDAIIVATRWGSIRYSEQLLAEMLATNEGPLKPSLFMQSTHNTPAGQLALHLHCHAHNSTISHGTSSFAAAEADASMMLMLREASNVLVCAYDEDAPILHLNPNIQSEPTVKAMLLIAQ